MIDVISLYPPQCEVKRTAQRTSPSISPDLLEHRCKMRVKLKMRANLSDIWILVSTPESLFFKLFSQSVGQSKILQAVNTTSHRYPCVFVQW